MNASLSSVTATGNNFHVLIDQEASVFKIGNKNILRDISENYIGKRPNRAYLRSGSFWNDIYYTHGWQQVESTLKVKNANIKGITTKPIIIDTKTLSNKSSHRATFNAGISSEVANTVESNWPATYSNYDSSLEGNLALNYYFSYNGHRHWSVLIKDSLLKSGMEINRQITEEIQIGYYSHSLVVIKDNQGKVKKIILFKFFR